VARCRDKCSAMTQPVRARFRRHRFRFARRMIGTPFICRVPAVWRRRRRVKPSGSRGGADVVRQFGAVSAPATEIGVAAVIGRGKAVEHEDFRKFAGARQIVAQRLIRRENNADQVGLAVCAPAEAS